MLTPELIAALPTGLQVLADEIEHCESMLKREDLPESVRAHVAPKRDHLMVLHKALAHVHHTNS